MRVLVQRVSSATVSVDGRVVGAIGPDGQGLLAFVGVTYTDGVENAQRLAEKLWKLRILDDEKSASDVNAPILVDADKLISKSKNSPFDGRRLQGKVLQTLVDGRTVYRA